MKFAFIFAAAPVMGTSLASYPLPTSHRSLTQLSSKSNKYASIGGELKNDQDINDMLFWTTTTIEGEEKSLAEKELKKTRDSKENSKKAMIESEKE